MIHRVDVVKGEGYWRLPTGAPMFCTDSECMDLEEEEEITVVVSDERPDTSDGFNDYFMAYLKPQQSILYFKLPEEKKWSKLRIRLVARVYFWNTTKKNPYFIWFE